EARTSRRAGYGESPCPCRRTSVAAPPTRAPRWCRSPQCARRAQDSMSDEPARRPAGRPTRPSRGRPPASGSGRRMVDNRVLATLPPLIRPAELVATLSLGTDLGLGQPMEHVIRETLIALRLAERLALAQEERAVVYYAGLLAWVGCHTDAYEQAKWFGD